jgi:gliding-associated putative ABC transporter substrate-binding component GldG
MKNIKYHSQSLIYVGIILGFVAVIAYLSSLKFVRLDFTDQKQYSISPATKKILRSLDDIVNVNVYCSNNLPPQFKTIEKDVRDLLSEYKAYAGGNLHITIEDPGKNEEEKTKVRGLGIQEVQLQTFEKDKAQAINAFMGMVVLYNDKKEVIPFIQDTKNFEYDLTQAIMKVFRSSVPKIGILKTDTAPYVPPRVRQRMNMNMQDAFEAKYKPVFDALRNNYEVSTVDISEGQPIDSSYKTVIVPGGDESAFSDRKLFEIDQYLMNGGNLIVLVDAVKVTFEYGVNGAAQNPKIIKMLEHYGARVENSMVLDASCGQVQVPQRIGMFQMNVAVPYPYFVSVYKNGFNQDNPAVSALSEMIMPWASPITLLVDKADSTGKKNADTSGVKATVLVKSSPKSWTASGNFNLDPQQKWALPEKDLKASNLVVYLSGNFKSFFAGKTIPPVKDTAQADSTKPIQLSAADQGRQIVPETKRGHLIIAGDADFLSAQNAAPGNVAFVQNAADWLSTSDNLIGIRTRAIVDRTMNKDQLKEGSSKSNIIRYVNILLMPIVLVLIGLMIFFKRRDAARAPADKPAAPAAANTKGA